MAFGCSTSDPNPTACYNCVTTLVINGVNTPNTTEFKCGMTDKNAFDYARSLELAVGNKYPTTPIKVVSNCLKAQ